MKNLWQKLKNGWKWFISLFVTAAVAVTIVNYTGESPVELTKYQFAQNCIATPKQIHECIGELNAEERADIKGQEIVRLVKSIPRTNVKFSGADYDIEIVETGAISNGIEVFARAWDSNGQIGFGRDGSVDLERFRIINPPILVADGTKKTINDTLPSGREISYEVDNFKEDPQQALLETIAHTVGVKKMKFGHENITQGKVGDTTTTVHPDADVESTSVDGAANNVAENQSWADMRAAAGNGSQDSSTDAYSAGYSSDAGTLNTWLNMYRGIFLFNTSAITDTDTISAATFSLYGTNKYEEAGDETVNVVSSAPASNTAVVNGDYDSLGTTIFADTAINITDWSTVAYNDFALNAAGIAAIDKAGITKFGLRMTKDITNTDPGSVGLDKNNLVMNYFADQAGTTSDPKLVIEHSGAAIGRKRVIIFENIEGGGAGGGGIVGGSTPTPTPDPPGSQVFTADGTWTSGVGITSVTVEAWGGGGAGAVRAGQGSGGGGGGAYIKAICTVIPQTDYAIDVATVLTSDTGTESDTTFATTMVVADGGIGATGTAGTAGGTTADSTTTCTLVSEFAGGTGGTGHTTVDLGGGGGGCAGPDGAGVIGADAVSGASIGAAGGAGDNGSGGAGGAGGNNVDGFPGVDNVLGAGGGGGSDDGTTGGIGGAPCGGGGGGDVAGGSSGRGQVKVTW